MDMKWAKGSTYKNRAELGDLLNDKNLLNVAVEVGTHRAEYAVAFLRRWKGKRFCAVDPWINGLEDYSDPVNVNDRNDDYAAAEQALSAFADRVWIKRMLSEDAAKDIEDDSIDFVYIDANHAERYVRQDINAWYPKVKAGGVIAGHDIVNGDLMDVRRAVKGEIYEKRGLDVFLIPGAAWSWYAIKP